LVDPTCAFVTRDPRVAGVPESGEVSFVSALNQNLGEQEIEGIDYNVEFEFDFKSPFGGDSEIDYQFIGRATQILTQTEEEFTVDGVNLDDDLGEYGNPEWRLNLTNRLSYKDFTLTFQSRYLDSMVEDNRPDFREEAVTTGFSRCVQTEGRFDANGNPNCRQFDGLADYWVHNASVAFARDTYVLRVGVNNVLDEAPPLTNNNALSSLGGIGYDLGGRTWFVNATKRF
jgi:iron complex outermembrane receptor protein